MYYSVQRAQSHHRCLPVPSSYHPGAGWLAMEHSVARAREHGSGSPDESQTPTRAKASWLMPSARTTFAHSRAVCSEWSR